MDNIEVTECQWQTDFSIEHIETCKKIAMQYETNPYVHSNDYIYQFILKSCQSSDPSVPLMNYFEEGAQTVLFFKKLLEDLFFDKNKPFSLLEFASGYGRITRHFNKILPQAKVVACDIHESAVDFINSFGVEAIQSSVIPEQFVTNQLFDVVFALSFFTHMPKSTWARWLEVLANQVAPGGLFIFTAHGNPALPLMGLPPFNQQGFWFSPFSEQADLPTHEYGSTATSFDYVYRQIMNLPLHLFRFQEAGCGYQDIYVLKK